MPLTVRRRVWLLVSNLSNTDIGRSGYYFEAGDVRLIELDGAQPRQRIIEQYTNIIRHPDLVPTIVQNDTDILFEKDDQSLELWGNDFFDDLLPWAAFDETTGILTVDYDIADQMGHNIYELEDRLIMEFQEVAG